MGSPGFELRNQGESGEPRIRAGEQGGGSLGLELGVKQEVGSPGLE